MSYSTFLETKRQYGADDGFEPVWMPDFLYPFQRDLCDWSIRKGRSAVFADCGLGKTPMQLVWAENVVRKTNKPVLVLTPLAVSYQTCDEAAKFGIDAMRSSDGKFSGNRVVVTNYERLHYFDSDDFSGVVCDESSILKNFNGQRKAEITEFMRRCPYRLLCTATAAPNDFDELGTSSEALGYLGYHDMLSRFFRQTTNKDHLGWGRTKYRLKGHAFDGFWRWVCSWSRSIRTPLDLGYDDDTFVLPSLNVQQHVVPCSRPRDGMLFVIPANTMQEQRDERRMTIEGRCEKVAELVRGHDSSVIWCHLNDEGDLLERTIPDAVQVSGKDSDDAKEQKLRGFQNGSIKRLVTKSKIAGWGLNWQHCSHMTTFPSHSFEQYYQSVRRLYRFGQTRQVSVDVVTTPGEETVIKNMTRKQDQADDMFSRLVLHMHDALHIERDNGFSKKEKVPSWLSNGKKSRTRMRSTTATVVR
jgi:hypothetical protein